MTDLWELEQHDASEHLVPKFEHVWKKYTRKWRSSHHSTGMPKSTGSTLPINGASETEALQMTAVGKAAKGKGKKVKEGESAEPPHPSVLWPLFLTFKWAVIGGGFYKLCFDVMQFASPHLLKHLISFIENPEQPMWVGIVLALGMFVIAMVQSMILHQYFHIMFRLGMNIKSVLTAHVYKKALRLSNQARRNRQIGEIVNLMAIDVQRFQDITTFMMLFWSSPLQVHLRITNPLN